jgi:hypothetical protein
VGPRAGLDVVDKIKNLLPLPGIKLQLCHSANSLVTILKELSHGVMMYKCPSRALMCKRASVERFSKEIIARGGNCNIFPLNF